MAAEADRCLACDEPLRPDARFCVDCGVAAPRLRQNDGRNASDDEPGDGGSYDDVLVLGKGGGDKAPDPSARRLRRLVGGLASAVAVVGVAALAWWIFSPQTETVSDVDYQLLAIDRRVPAGWAAPSADGQADLTLVPNEPGQDSDKAAILEPVEVTATFQPDPSLAGTELLAGTAAFLTRVDLGTLEQQTVDIPGPVVANFGDQLILQASGGGLMLAPLDDPFDTTPIVDMEGGRRQLTDLTIDDRGRLFVSYFDFVEAEFDGQPESNVLVFDLATGRPVENPGETVAPTDWNTSIGVTWNPGVGTIGNVDGQATPLSDGFPIASGQNVILILRCDHPNACEEQWVDRATGEVLADRALSPFPGFGPQIIRPTDRYLTAYDSRFGYFDTETGVQIPSPRSAAADSSGPFGVSGGRPEWTTEDGRLLIPARSAVLVYDPERAAYSRIDLDIEWTVTFIGLLDRESSSGG